MIIKINLFKCHWIEEPKDVTRNHLFDYIDEQLIAKYKVSTINHDLHTFQGTLRFLQQQGTAVPHQLLTLSGLRKSITLPRFLTDAQVITLRDNLMQRVELVQTSIAQRNSRLDLAAFYLLWHCGIRVSELEDLQLSDVDFVAGAILIREAKGLKDRSVYLTKRVVETVQQYLELRGPALTGHLFIYRHKPLSKDLIRGRLKAVGKRLGFKATPHMLRHTFGTQLVNAGCKITTIQALMGHKRLSTTLVYTNIHNHTVAEDYYTAMAKVETRLTDQLPKPPTPQPKENGNMPDSNAKAAQLLTLAAALQVELLPEGQQSLLMALRHGLKTLAETTNNSLKQPIVNEQPACPPDHTASRVT